MCYKQFKLLPVMKNMDCTVDVVWLSTIDPMIQLFKGILE